MSHPIRMNSVASQSSNSGFVGLYPEFRNFTRFDKAGTEESLPVAVYCDACSKRMVRIR